MARLSQVFVPRDREFFDLFEEAGANILRAADLLDRMLRNYPDTRELAREILLCEQEGHTKLIAVSGVAGLCLAQSESRTPEQSVSQCCGPTCASLALNPVPSCVMPQPRLFVHQKPWPTQDASSR